MKSILGVTVAAAGLLLAVSAANAANNEPCHNGYRISMGTILECSGGPQTAAMAPMAEPRFTGSIPARQPGVAAPPVENRVMMVTSQQACRPGAYWSMSNPNGDTMVRCPG